MTPNNRPKTWNCRKHGADVEPRIVALIAAEPGWNIAHKPITSDEGKVWTDPIAAWAHVVERNEHDCSCRDRRVRALIAGEYGSLEFADDESHVQPPGFVAEWSDARGWALCESGDDKPPPRSGKRLA